MAKTEAVTTIVRRVVKPGREADYEQWVKDTTEDLKKSPGYIDITMIKPNTGANKSKEYVLIIKFDSFKHVEDWENSEKRNYWMNQASDFTEQLSNQKVTGLEYWFPLPEIPKGAVPKRWKMAVVTFLAIFPLSVIVNLVFNILPWKFSFLMRGALVSVALVVLMTYLVMPFMTSIFRPWLFPKK